MTNHRTRVLALRRLTAAGLPAMAMSIIAISINAIPAQATELVTNGNFSDVGNETTSYQVSGSNLPGWTTTSGYSFVVFPGQATSGFGGISLYSFPNASPDGGNFLLQDGAYQVGTLSQTLTGLTVGQAYTVSFYEASGQQSGYSGATTEQWDVSFGDQSQELTLMSTPYASSIGWLAQSMTFVADATTEVLGFLAQGTPQGQPPFVGLAQVSVVATPEPATITLVAVGMAGILGARRRRHKRS